MKIKLKKEPILEAITFDELVQFGRDNGANIVNGMPWSFTYKGVPITHEKDKCYLICNPAKTYKFIPSEMLVTGITGLVFNMAIKDFNKMYEPIK